MELPNLKIGLTGSAEITVQDADTAPRIGSGRVSVLATPVMINLMDAAALNAVERLLPHGHQSLGTRLEVGHYAATPVGMRLRATAELTKVSEKIAPCQHRKKSSAPSCAGGKSPAGFGPSASSRC